MYISQIFQELGFIALKNKIEIFRTFKQFQGGVGMVQERIQTEHKDHAWWGWHCYEQSRQVTLPARVLVLECSVLLDYHSAGTVCLHINISHKCISDEPDPTAKSICSRRVSIFWHVRHLQESVPVHEALHLRLQDPCRSATRWQAGLEASVRSSLTYVEWSASWRTTSGSLQMLLGTWPVIVKSASTAQQPEASQAILWESESLQHSSLYPCK